MNYQRIYNQIVDRAKKRELKGYTESHHIIPKCMGGSNKKENLVRLTAREHFICHWLLHRINPNNSGLSFAFKMMITVSTKKQHRYTPSSRTIKEAKEAGAIASSKAMKGVKKSKEHRQKVINANTGKKRTEEVKKVLSNLKLGKPNGRSKGVYQMDLEGTFIKWHRTTVEAAKELGIHHSNIQAAASGKYSSSGGFKWTYGQTEDSVRLLNIKKIEGMLNKLDNEKLIDLLDFIKDKVK